MTTKRQKILAAAELVQASTRHARSEHDGEVAGRAAAERLGRAFDRAMRVGITFDQAYDVQQETTRRVEAEGRRGYRTTN